LLLAAIFLPLILIYNPNIFLWSSLFSFVSEHIETLEEIDVEYKELALESGIKNWGRVPALGCEPTFISDLADAVIESLPYVGAMAVSNLEARQVTTSTWQENSYISFVWFGQKTIASSSTIYAF
jgi:hypothetical protein